MGCVGMPKAGGYGFIWGEGEPMPRPLLLGPGLEGPYYLPVLPPSQNPLPLREGAGTGGEFPYDTSAKFTSYWNS